MKFQNKFQEKYYKLRYRRWVVVDSRDRLIIYEGSHDLCELVQDTQYAGLYVMPRRHAKLLLESLDGGGKRRR